MTEIVKTLRHSLLLEKQLFCDIFMEWVMLNLWWVHIHLWWSVMCSAKAKLQWILSLTCRLQTHSDMLSDEHVSSSYVLPLARPRRWTYTQHLRHQWPWSWDPKDSLHSASWSFRFPCQRVWDPAIHRDNPSTKWDEGGCDLDFEPDAEVWECDGGGCWPCRGGDPQPAHHCQVRWRTVWLLLTSLSFSSFFHHHYRKISHS